MKRIKMPLAADKEYVVAERKEVLKPLYDVRVNLVTLRAHIEVLNQMIDLLNADDKSKSTLRDRVEQIQKYADKSYEAADKLDDKFR